MAWRALSAALLVLLCAAVPAHSMYASVKPGNTKCFLEDVPADTKISVEWAVVGGEDREFGVLFTAKAREGNIGMLAQKRLPRSGREDFMPSVSGEYEFCFKFDGVGWRSTVEYYEFTVDIETGAEAIDYDKLANAEDLSNFQVMLRHLSNQLVSIQKEQQYTREMAVDHNSLANATNDQIIYWSVIETIVLVGLSVYQVHHLKKFFKSKKLM